MIPVAMSFLIAIVFSLPADTTEVGELESFFSFDWTEKLVFIANDLELLRARSRRVFSNFSWLDH